KGQHDHTASHGVKAVMVWIETLRDAALEADWDSGSNRTFHAKHRLGEVLLRVVGGEANDVRAGVDEVNDRAHRPRWTGSSLGGRQVTSHFDASIGRKRVVIIQAKIDASPDAFKAHARLAAFQGPVRLTVQDGGVQVKQLIINDDRVRPGAQTLAE